MSAVATTQKRVVFDFEIDFSNGGGLQGQGFRLDIEGEDISDAELADYIVSDMRLLMVGAVRIRNKRIIEEAQFVAEDVYRQHYLTFVEGYGRNLAAARARGEISEGPDELRAWALIGMCVFLGMRYGIWKKDRSPEAVADLAIDFVSEGLRKR